MMNMKAAASLTGSLLARKGAAYPASYSAPTPSADNEDGATPAARAYNDPRVIASAPPAPVQASAFSAPAPQHGGQMQDGRLAPKASEPAKAPEPEAELPGESYSVEATDEVGLPQTMDKMGRVRLSVRLDPDRYLRVKMASARTRWSAQDIVIAALDRYLGGKAESAPESEDDDSHGNLN
jgi:hypothetical protein